mmetsp:Transcript_26251/g.55833  ORF Transcript_26251/g.55833 Transcript_26251/m.55833 type:complete len:106 (+) Transcript_26251:465-782(+)
MPLSRCARLPGGAFASARLPGDASASTHDATTCAKQRLRLEALVCLAALASPATHVPRLIIAGCATMPASPLAVCLHRQGLPMSPPLAAPTPTPTPSLRVRAALA